MNGLATKKNKGLRQTIDVAKREKGKPLLASSFPRYWSAARRVMEWAASPLVGDCSVLPLL